MTVSGMNSGVETAKLNVDTFTRVVLVKKTAQATFNCQYTNAALTEWYFDQKKIMNDTGAQEK